MPQRPPAHINEDLAKSFLREAFFRFGWAVNEVHSDYGEDLLVRIFNEGKATPFSFFVQSKSIQNISKRTANNGRSIYQKISTLHLRSWLTFREPVILAVTDIESHVTYWECVQTNISCQEAVKKDTSGNHSFNVNISSEKTLNDTGLHQIEAITKSLYEKSNRERAALLALINCLNSQYGLTVQCDTQTGMLVLPSGSFTPNTTNDPLVFLFGKRGKHFSELLLNNDMTNFAAAIKKGISLRKAFEWVLRTEKMIPLLDPKTGKIMYKIKSMEEYDKAMGELTEKYMTEKGY